MTGHGAILDAIVTSIAPASASHAADARARVAQCLGRTATPPNHPPNAIEQLAGLLGGAQHKARPIAKQRFVVVVAGDHGSASATACGEHHPTVMAAHAIASGTAALARVAQLSDTSIILVNAGAAESRLLPHSAISLGAEPTRDFERGPAMSIEEAYRALEAGVALSVSLAEHTISLRTPSSGAQAQPRSLALLAVGAIGQGADRAAAALLNATISPLQPSVTAGATLLAQFGGPETGVLAGLMLGAASMKIPVILDSYATGAAAIVAAAIAPAVLGYLIAAHSGSHSMPKILAHLECAPLFEVGLGIGDATGAAMVVPLADQVAALVREQES